MTATVAALFVSPKGPYINRPDVDAWTEDRDARNYAGPLPVVAHPPCQRWCRLAKFIQSQGQLVGDDNGTFEFALSAVNRFGGVLEHPAWSIAWAWYGLIAPPAWGWRRTKVATLGSSCPRLGSSRLFEKGGCRHWSHGAKSAPSCRYRVPRYGD